MTKLPPLSLSFTLVVLLPIALQAGGCVARTRELPSSERHLIRRIAVVPMEAPPLEFNPGISMLQGCGGGVVTGPPLGAGVIAVVCGILMLADIPRATAEARTTAANLDSMLEIDVTWHPTVVLARHLAGRLREGGAGTVTAIEAPYHVPGIERRRRTFLMQNWQVPIRSWFNEDTSPIDYSDLATRGFDVVLETGLWGYVISKQGTVASDIMVKLTNVHTGAVVAKTRQYSVDCGRVAYGSDEGGKVLRATITACLEALGDRALERMGLP